MEVIPFLDAPCIMQEVKVSTSISNHITLHYATKGETSMLYHSTNCYVVLEVMGAKMVVHVEVSQIVCKYK